MIVPNGETRKILKASRATLSDQQALENRTKECEIGKKTLENTHPDNACSLHNMGGSYSNLGEHQKALEYYQKASEIREKIKS